MNSREKQIKKAINLLGEEKLLQILRSLRWRNRGYLALKLFFKHIAAGQTLEQIFFTGDEYGYILNLKEKGENTYQIEFGYLADGDCGEGMEWIVRIRGKRVFIEEQLPVWIA